MAIWSIFTFLLFICTLALNAALATLFFLLTITFALLSAGVTHATTNKVGGARAPVWLDPEHCRECTASLCSPNHSCRYIVSPQSVLSGSDSLCAPSMPRSVLASARERPPVALRVREVWGICRPDLTLQSLAYTGWFGLITAITAFYIAFAELFNDTVKKDVLPLGAFSWLNRALHTGATTPYDVNRTDPRAYGPTGYDQRNVRAPGPA